MTAITRTLHPRPVILVAGLLAAVSVTASAIGLVGEPSRRAAVVGALAGLLTLFVAELARDRLLFEGGDTIRLMGAAGALLAVPAGLLTLSVDRSTPVERVAGADRIATSAAVSAEAFETADAVVLVSATSPTDAVTAASLARQVAGPLLLTSAEALPSAVAEEIERLGATSAYLVGATAVAPPRESLRTAGIDQVMPVTGEDRYATSAAILSRTRPDIVYVTSSWKNALAAPIYDGAGLLTIARNDVTPDASTALQQSQPSEIVVLGDEGAVSDNVVSYLRALVPSAAVERAEVADRWSQSLATFEESGHSTAWPWVAAGTSWPDAVTAGVGAAAQARPLLLVPSRESAPSAATVRWLRENRSAVSELTVVGGEAAVPDGLVSRSR